MTRSGPDANVPPLQTDGHADHVQIGDCHAVDRAAA